METPIITELYRLRAGSRTSLRTLSEATQLCTSYLSMVERRRLVLSAEQQARIAAHFQRDPLSLFEPYTGLATKAIL
jgi:hypothetical protein